MNTREMLLAEYQALLAKGQFNTGDLASYNKYLSALVAKTSSTGVVELYESSILFLQRVSDSSDEFTRTIIRLYSTLGELYQEVDKKLAAYRQCIELFDKIKIKTENDYMLVEKTCKTSNSLCEWTTQVKFRTAETLQKITSVAGSPGLFKNKEEQQPASKADTASPSPG